MGQERILLRLVEPVDLVDEEDGAPAAPPARRSARAMTSLISLMPDRTALNETNRAVVRSAIRRASVVLPVPGGPQKIIDCSRSRSIASRSGAPGASSASWPTNSSSVRGPHALGQRRRLRLRAARPARSMASSKKARSSPWLVQPR